MAKEFDDYEPRDDDEDFEERGPSSPGVVSAARKRCGMPGMILIIFGLVGILIEIASIGVALTQPFLVYDQVIKFYEGMPPGPERDKMIKDFKQQKEQMRTDKPLSLGGNVLGLILNAFMVIGGMKMRSLSSYGLSLTGAICGLIPLSGCICCAMPFGLWALIVLCNADVKRGFTAVARSSQ